MNFVDNKEIEDTNHLDMPKFLFFIFYLFILKMLVTKLMI